MALSGINPLRCSSRSWTVIVSLSFCAKAGKIDETLSDRLSLPRSISCIILVAVATGLVMEAMSKTVSTVIGSIDGSNRLFPYAFSNRISSLRPTQTTHPGILPSATPVVTRSLICPRRSTGIRLDSLTTEGGADASCATSRDVSEMAIRARTNVRYFRLVDAWCGLVFGVLRFIGALRLLELRHMM